MYAKSIDIWEKINDISIARYRCFQTIPENKYYVQSQDYYYWDSENHCIKRKDFDTIENNYFNKINYYQFSLYKFYSKRKEPHRFYECNQ